MPDLFGTESMLALSWKQPFGTAMLFGKIETRVWNTKYRGKVLICTSKAAYDIDTVKRICGIDNFIRMCQVMDASPSTLDMDGYAIAVGDLIDSYPMRRIDEERSFVKFHPDLYCHLYENVRPIKPFPWKGSQGWKKVDLSIIEKIEFL